MKVCVHEIYVSAIYWMKKKIENVENIAIYKSVSI